MFNRQLDQGVLSGVRGFSSLVTKGCESPQEGYLLGQASHTVLSQLMSQPELCSTVEVSETTSLEEVLASFLTQKGYGCQHKNVGMCLWTTGTKQSRLSFAWRERCRFWLFFCYTILHRILTLRQAAHAFFCWDMVCPERMFAPPSWHSFSFFFLRFFGIFCSHFCLFFLGKKRIFISVFHFVCCRFLKILFFSFGIFLIFLYLFCVNFFILGVLFFLIHVLPFLKWKKCSARIEI